MVATCYRRMGQTDKAFKLYHTIHSLDPESVECLKSALATLSFSILFSYYVFHISNVPHSIT